MEDFDLELQRPQPMDEATRVAVELAEAQFERGEFVTLEEAIENARKRYQEWKQMPGQKAAA